MKEHVLRKEASVLRTDLQRQKDDNEALSQMLEDLEENEVPVFPILRTILSQACVGLGDCPKGTQGKGGGLGSGAPRTGRCSEGTGRGELSCALR